MKMVIINECKYYWKKGKLFFDKAAKKTVPYRYFNYNEMIQFYSQLH